MQLSTIVNVTITALTKQLTQLGFGTPLIMRYHTAWSALVREFASLTEMTDAGLATDDPAVLMATKMWSQNPRPATIKIGKRTNAFTQLVELTPVNITEAFVYSFSIGGVAITATVPSTPDLAKVCDAFVTAINAAMTGVATATDKTTYVEVETDDPGVLLDYEFAIAAEDMLFAVTTVDPGLDDDLAAVEIADPSGWYGLLLDSNGQEEVEYAAEWCEARTKLFAYNTSDSLVMDPGTSTDVCSILMAAAYTHSFGLFSKARLLIWSAAAWMAQCLSMDPGTESWCYKNLAGIAWDSGLLGGEETAIIAKRCAIYSSIGGQNFTFEGKVASGEWIDVVRFIHWLTARMQERCMSALLNSRKVPFTDSGIDSIVSMVSAQLADGVRVGGLAADPKPTVTAPKAADVSDANKALRKLPDINFEAHLAGAIHLLVINGAVSL